MKKTKIVATIGPASESEEVLRKLFTEGVNVARLNFSHGSHQEHKLKIDRIKKLRREMDIPIGIMLDTKGPEIRLGDIDGEVLLKSGEEFILTNKDLLGNEKIASISYKDLYKDVRVGGKILIDDGLVELLVKEIRGEEIITEVENSGLVSSHKGVNVPGANLNLPALTERDIEDIKFGIKEDIDFIAASFVRSREDVLAIRKVLEEERDYTTKIISKIESQRAVEEIDEIIEVSDGIMVARGDLGVEIETEAVPIVQKEIIKKCNIVGKTVITATQMLDSMIRNPRPTRAETNDVANAVLDGTSAVMLSGETASGKYPLEAVVTMRKILEYTENTIDHEEILENRIRDVEKSMTNAIGRSACVIARDLGAQAIITATTSGNTSRAIAKFRPETPIIASTPFEKIKNQLSLVWGISPVKVLNFKDTDNLIDASMEIAVAKGFIKSGDLVVLTAGVPAGIAGSTNLLKIESVSEILGRGTPIGKKKKKARAIVAKTIEDLEDGFKTKDIIVCQGTDGRMIPYMEKSSGFITEEAGFTSNGAVAAISLGKTAIVGVKDITEKIKTGDIITIDPVDGTVRR
ncbi:MAG: pyruvate kinase [Peptoniphilus grossensis]|uniref:pyruvate kinase n=1 Tax=Peptoniphilus grossensis TaxID=1465756 RepID=UPI00290ECFEE|nr:pyruvate kinase [Peptoniphilus grossensis]MDU7151202.1 pyruvate kinase [Peptoniphilus grossensis]